MRSRGILLTPPCTLLIAALIAAQNTPAASPQATTAMSGSPSTKIGVFVNPKNSQSPQQQADDEKACYATAEQQTGIDPSAPPAPPPEAAKKQGGGAKGAAGGAAIGAIAGDAGTGATIGATAGAARGRRQQKKANQQPDQQAVQQGQAQQQKLDTFRRAFSSCIDAKG